MEIQYIWLLEILVSFIWSESHSHFPSYRWKKCLVPASLHSRSLHLGGETDTNHQQMYNCKYIYVCTCIHVFKIIGATCLSLSIHSFIEFFKSWWIFVSIIKSAGNDDNEMPLWLWKVFKMCLLHSSDIGFLVMATCKADFHDSNAEDQNMPLQICHFGIRVTLSWRQLKQQIHSPSFT